MWTIERVHGGYPITLPDAQRLLEEYRAFLLALGRHANFDFNRFTAEVESLPASFEKAWGEFLVIHSQSAPRAGALMEPSRAVGCIAYQAAPRSVERYLPGPWQPACELKRLWITPSARGAGLGRRLVDSALHHATDRAYRWAVLDIEPQRMPAAYRLLLQAGFEEFEEHEVCGLLVVWLRKLLAS